MVYLQEKKHLERFPFVILIAAVLWCGSAAAYDQVPAKMRLLASPALPPSRQTSSALEDQQLQEKVTSALESDRYFYAAHVTVSVSNEVVVLHGFVFSDWDLRDAIRIATRAAGGKRVVDDLAIEVGGRR